jgi:hypothetical protein
MTNKELQMLNRYLSTSYNYFEWGSGDSTKMACSQGIKRIYSVEGDFNYFVKTRGWCPEACVNYVDIDADNTSFSYPRSDKKKHNWRTYWHFIATMEMNQDLVLIDGRFRMLCALSTYAHVDEDCTILVHDYRDREYYHDMEKIFDIVDSADTLYAFKKKPLDTWMYDKSINLDIKYEDDVR